MKTVYILLGIVVVTTVIGVLVSELLFVTINERSIMYTAGLIAGYIAYPFLEKGGEE